MAEYIPSENLKPEALAAFYLREAQNCTDPLRKAELLAETGWVFEHQLGNLAKAVELYSEALKNNAKNLDVLKALYQARATEKNWPAALQHLQQLQTILFPGDPKKAKEISPTQTVELVSCLLDQARILHDHLKDNEKAFHAYARVLQLDPENPQAFSGVEGILTGLQDWKGLIGLIDQILPRLQDKYSRVSMCYLKAQVALKWLKDRTLAVQALRDALTTDPLNLAALKLLQEIFQQDKKWLELAPVYEQMAALFQSKHEAGQMFAQAAQIWLELAGNRERGVACLEKAIQLTPEDWESLERLRKHYLTLQDWKNLHGVLGRQLELVRDQQIVRSLQYDLSETAERLGNRDEAIQWLKRVLESDPQDLPALKSLGSYYTSNKDWASLAKLYENELEVTKDTAHNLSVLLRLANIYERHLNNPAQAISCYLRAVQIWPQNPLLAWQLQRLYTVTKDWEKLVLSLTKELEQTAEPLRKRDILEQLGDLARERFHDDAKAIYYFQEVLKVVPNDFRIFAKLQELFRQSERWQDLANLIGMQISHAKSPPEAVGLYLQVAEIFDQRLDQFDSAAFCYQKALEIIPNHLPAIHALGSLLFRKGRWQRLVALYEQEMRSIQEPVQKALLFFRMGQILQNHLKDPEKAIQSYRSAVSLHPTFFAAYENLLPLYEQVAAWKDWLSLMKQMVTTMEDPKRKSMIYLRMAEVHLNSLENVEAAKEDLLTALKEDTKNYAAFRMLFDLYQREAQWADLASLLQQLIERTQDKDWKKVLLIRLAEIREGYLRDLPGAMDAWEGVVTIDNESFLALDSLERLYRARQAWPELLKTLGQRSAVHFKHQNKHAATGVLEECAEIAVFELKDLPRACSFLLKILEVDPNRNDIFERLRRIYIQFVQWESLAELLRQQIKRFTAQGEGNHPALVGYYQELGWVLEFHLKKNQEAIACWERIYQVDPSNLRVFKSLERLYSGSKNLKGIADLYMAFSAHLFTTAEKVRVLITAGQIYTSELNQFDRAQEAFEKAVAIDPNREDVWPSLKALYEKTENWQGLISANDKLVALYQRLKKSPSDQTALLRQSAGLYETKLNNTSKAIASYQQALLLMPGDLETSANLVRLHSQLKDWEAVLTDYSHWLEHLREPMQAVNLYHDRGVVLESQLQQNDYAAQHYQKALALDSDHLSSIKHLSRIYFQKPDWEHSREFLERWLSLEKEQGERTEALIFLGKVYRKGLSNLDKAKENFEEALKSAPASSEAMDALCEIYEEKKEWPQLVTTLESTLKRTTGGDAKQTIPVQLKIAKIRAEQLNNRDAAIDTYKRVLELDDKNIDAHLALANLYSKYLNEGFATQAINEYRAVLDLDILHVESYRSLARVYEKTSQYDKVYCLYQMLDLLGVATQTEKAFVKDNRANAARESKKALTSEDRIRFLLVGGALGPVRDFLTTFAPAIDKIYKPGTLPFGKQDRLTAQSRSAYRDLCDKVALMFAVETYDFCLGKDDKKPYEIHNTEPLTLVVSPSLLKRISVDEQRFVYGALLFMAKDRLDLAFRLKPAEIKNLMRVARTGLQAAANKSEARFSGADQELFQNLDTNIPKKIRKNLMDFASKMKPETEKFDEKLWQTALEESIMCAGALAAKDIPAALGAYAKLNSKMKDLRLSDLAALRAAFKERPAFEKVFAFLVSEDYFGLRKRLALGII